MDFQAGQVKSKLGRITIGHYLEMIVSGALPHDVRTELLDGRIIEQLTKYAPHNFTARQLGILLKAILPPAWLISEEKSLDLGRYWRPEPDIALIRGPNTRYRKSDPTSKDVSLLIEVVDSSYATDRGEKWRAYAAARIPIYWIVNLELRQIEVYSVPIGRGQKASFRQAATFGADSTVPVVTDGQEIGRIEVGVVLP